ncbi:MAG: cysteine peptidase family C39 domain-containing protein [Bacilli bacterium]
MINSILCGSSCVKYVLSYYKHDNTNINLHMTWVTELAISLKENGISNFELMCYKSNLYLDYIKNKNIDLTFDGFKYMQKLLSYNIPIIEKKFDNKELLKELKQSKFIILCVESSVYNSKNMNGGHFIILNGIEKDKIKIINPIKEKYEYKFEKLEDIIKYCKNYGCWRILIKEER